MIVELRPWTTGDAAALCTANGGDQDLQAQFGGVDLGSLGSSQKYINEYLVMSETRRNWAICVDYVAIGNVGLSGVERRHGTAWASYWLASPYRGRGLAARALATVASVAFQEGLFRLELGHRVNNPASCNVATRAGFVPEGIERKKLRYGSQRFDVETHARLLTDPAPDVAPLPIQAYKATTVVE